MKHIYTSLDIGSDSIKIAVCELYQNKLNLLAATSCKAEGIKRGLIADFDAACNSVAQAFQNISDMVGFKVDKVIASVPSYMAEYNIVKGSISLNQNNQITPHDVMKTLEKAITSKKIEGREMVTVLPIDFKINDEIVLRDPVGNRGNKLSTRAVLVTVPKKNVYSVLTLLEKIGIEVIDISINNIGDLYIFNNKKFDENVAAIINIGSDITSLSLYSKNVIVKSAMINDGAKYVDVEIANYYKLDIATAKKLKNKFALASKKHASANDFVECQNINGETIKIRQSEISEIVEYKVKDILNSAKNELNNLTSKKIDYIIITGGMSNMTAFEFAVHDIFDINVNIGAIKMIGARDNKYSSVVGNIIYFISKLKLKGQDYTMIKNDETGADSNNGSAPDSALSKIFGYFFND